MHQTIFMFQFNKKEGDNIFLKERKYKDITRLYNIIDIVNGLVITNKGEVNIYQVKPCTVIGKSEELKQNIYNAYLVFIKMITFNYQIIITTGKTDFNEILSILNENMYSSYNLAQKKMIGEYVQYLFDLSKDIQHFTKTFYIVTNKLTTQEEKQFKEAFNSVKHLGISIDKITDETSIYNILYESINKISKGVKENEY